VNQIRIVFQAVARAILRYIKNRIDDLLEALDEMADAFWRASTCRSPLSRGRYPRQRR